MSEQEEILSKLWKKLDVVSQMQVRWNSRNPGAKTHKLSEIWGELKEMPVHVGDDIYTEVEELRLKILDQMSRVNGTLFKEFAREFRDDIISARAEASLLGIRLFSLPSRLFEQLYEWQKHHDESRVAH